jgi:hypothetical protein
MKENKNNLGAGGFCICPKCGEKLPHQQGEPCQDILCPKCNTKMLREGSEHHKMFLEKHQK